MIRGMIKLLVIGVLFFVIVLPARHFVKKIMVSRQLEKQENEAIGSAKMSNPRVKDIQRILQGLNHYAGPVDGEIGEKTRMALRNFQNSRGLNVTGFVDTKTLAELNKMEYVLQASKDPQWLIKQSAGNFQKNGGQSRDKKINSFPERTPKIKDVQLALQKAGFYKGNIDGKLGLQTKKAIKEFQLSRNLKADGMVGLRTWGELKRSMPDNQ